MLFAGKPNACNIGLPCIKLELLGHSETTCILYQFDNKVMSVSSKNPFASHLAFISSIVWSVPCRTTVSIPLTFLGSVGICFNMLFAKLARNFVAIGFLPPIPSRLKVGLVPVKKL